MTRHLKQALLLRTALLKTLPSEKEKHYCQVLSLWLRKRCSRQEFDYEVMKFLSETGFKLHTKFINCLAKISCGLMALPLKNNTTMRKLSNVENIEVHKLVDNTIPCPAICTARFYIGAWSSGLISVQPEIGKLLHLALMHFLKDIIFSLISVKKSCNRKTNHFKFFSAKEKVKDVDVTLPAGFINNNNNITSGDLILALRLNPGIAKMGLSKYVEKVVNGPSVNNVAGLIPLTL